MGKIMFLETLSCTELKKKKKKRFNSFNVMCLSKLDFKGPFPESGAEYLWVSM